MKILYRYLGKNLLITFLATLLVMIGILCVGNLIKIVDMVVKGMDLILLGKFLWFIIIRLLQYAIPMAILTATLLVFGRLAADNEITAMRASGVGMGTITRPVFFIGFFLTLIAIYLNNNAIPNHNFASRQLRKQFGLQDPELLLEPGEFIKLPGYAISIQDKKNDHLENITIYQYQSGKLISAITAKQARIENRAEKKKFIVHLYDGIFDEYDQDNPHVSTRTSFEYLQQALELGELFEEANISKRTKDMTRSELLRSRDELMGMGKDMKAMISQITTELHKRLSLSLACFSFVLIGIPLAIKTHRGEKSIGMSISLILIFVFYLFVLYSKAVAESPRYYPQLIVWIPNILYGGSGIFLMLKVTRI